MKIKLPKINYSYWLSEWNKNIGIGKVYSNKNIEKYLTFDKDINACNKEISELTKISNPDKFTVLHVVDLIYSWGGRSGRMFYSKTKEKISPREELEKNEAVYNIYVRGLKLAQEGKTESLEIFKTIRGIGSSYASKHSYFWSLNSNSPLIIVDSKIAGALGFTTIDKLENMSPYNETIKSFIDKSIEVFNSKNPSKVEKALFSFHNFYFLNDNSGWKNQEESEDFEVAKELSKILFDN